ncbi:uncharacterized protein LOC116134261 isoform X2 [Pistacia vera]|uniref:uncharacterized protein LOC116134261 isoform X2 n=1 Tax=Pistacia vera TaxID=55513 RepID=UPI0012632247|nr:uncharacterized protein LOC116134261 isoform X2 [Pistacia vera]
MVQVNYFINFLNNQFHALVFSLWLSKRKFQELTLAKHRIPSKGDVSHWAKLSGFKNSCLPLKFKTHWTKCYVLANTNYITFVFYSPQKVVVNSASSAVQI